MNYPKNWKKVKFGELAKERSERVDNPGESGYEIYIGLEHLDSGSLIIRRKGSTEDVKSSMKLFKENDLLFARRNTYLRRVSVAQFDGVCSGDIIVLQPILDHIIEGFLPIFMQFEDFENKIIALSAGAFSKRIKWKQLANEEVWVPSKEEQKRIVETIWSIQDNLNKTENLISTTEKLKKGLLNQLLTKGIGHKKFKKTEIGEIPVEWGVKRLKEITNLIRDGTHFTPKYIDSGIPFLRVTDIQDKEINWENVKYISPEEHETLTKRVKPQKGDILLSKNGTIGITKIVDWDREFSIFVSLCLIRPDIGEIDLDYLCYFLNSDVCLEQIKLRSKQGTVTNLHLEEINDFLITLPSLKEQKEIVKIIFKVDSFLNRNKYHLQSTSKLKKKLTDDFISGKIQV